MTSPADMVREFHEAYNVPSRDRPQLPGRDERQLREALLGEEHVEYWTAERDDDLIEIADALADMVYVIYGTALAYGIDLDAVLAEVHRSNMSKLGADGEPIYRADGKVLKGPAFFRPDIASVLGVKA